MLTDPQTVGSSSLALTKPEPSRSTYSNAAGDKRLIVANQPGKSSTRYVVRLEEDSVETDPLTGTNKIVTKSAQVTMDQPLIGITDSEQSTLTLELLTWLSASSAANLLAVLSGQH
jgi:hypothetical protein